MYNFFLRHTNYHRPPSVVFFVGFFIYVCIYNFLFAYNSLVFLRLWYCTNCLWLLLLVVVMMVRRGYDFLFAFDYWKVHINICVCVCVFVCVVRVRLSDSWILLLKWLVDVPSSLLNMKSDFSLKNVWNVRRKCITENFLNIFVNCQLVFFNAKANLQWLSSCLDFSSQCYRYTY